MTDEPTSGDKKLLSICAMGRDDDYDPDFKYRLTTTLNYISRNLLQLGRLNDVEILVTDWGSEVPLAESLVLSPQAAEICRFIYVPPAVIRSLQDGKEDFHISMAANAGIRRAQGEFILISAGDTLIPRHALEMILRILEDSLGLSLSIRAKETLFLCPRYQIPWQFVVRQPGLEAWDRYLLLSGSELKYEDYSLLAIGSGAGGFLMHRDLWQEARGLDEQLGGWGFQDIDLGLRVSQRYPWLGLSSVGVNLYHMGHAPGGRRVDAVANPNPMRYNWNVEVNSEGWGLAEYQFQEQRSGAVGASKAVAVVEVNHTSIEKSKQRIEEIVKELATGSVYEHVIRSIRLFPGNSVVRDDIEALVFLAWRSLRFHPGCYLEFGIRRGYAAVVVAGANPGVEMYGFDEWEGVVPGDTAITGVFVKLRLQVGYRAYARFLNGPLHTGLARLRESFVGPFCPDLVFVRGERLGENLPGQVADLLKCLAPGGAIIITSGQPGTLDSLWRESKEQFPQGVLFLGKSGRTAMILADDVLISAATDSTPIICDFDVKLILRQITLQTPVSGPGRMPWALSQPGRYPEFAARLLVRFARRLWPQLAENLRSEYLTQQ